jgi:hypothetical protein
MSLSWRCLFLAVSVRFPTRSNQPNCDLGHILRLIQLLREE